MTRTEFCKLMSAVKSKAGKTTTELAFEMRAQWGALRRIEVGANNFSVDTAIRYLRLLNTHIIIQSCNSERKIMQYDDVVDWMKDVRNGKLSQRALADSIGCSYVNIANIETKKSIMKIDTLLKIIDLLGYTIKLETNEQDS